MNEIESYQEQLPDTLEDLTQFVLIGRSKLNAYKLKLQKVDKLSDAQNIREQTLQDMQDVSIAIVAAEQRIGEILLSIQKNSGGDRRSDDFKNHDSLNFEKTKDEVTSEMGYSRNQVSEYQRLAQNPEIVQKVIDDALEKGEIVTRTQVMKEIRSAKEELKRQLAEKDKKISELENREPEIKTVKVVPDDYEMYKNGYQRIVDERQKAVKELSETRKILDQMKKSTPESKLVDDAKEQMAYFTIATYKYLKNYGGFTWAFDKWPDVPESTKRDFRRAIETLAGFSQQMMKNLEALNEQ